MMKQVKFTLKISTSVVTEIKLKLIILSQNMSNIHHVP